MDDSFEYAMNGRKLFYANKFDEAAASLKEGFSKEPRAWWLAMEAWRATHRLESSRSENVSEKKYEKDIQIFFDPDYQGNSYQKILYCEANLYRASAAYCSGLDTEIFLRSNAFNRKTVFHLHWLKEIYSGCLNFKDGIK